MIDRLAKFFGYVGLSCFMLCVLLLCLACLLNIVSVLTFICKVCFVTAVVAFMMFVCDTISLLICRLIDFIGNK